MAKEVDVPSGYTHKESESEVSTCAESTWRSVNSNASDEGETSRSSIRRSSINSLVLDSDLSLDPVIHSPFHTQRRASTRRTLKLRLNMALEATEHLDKLEDGQTGGVYKVLEADPDPLAIFKPEGQEHFERRGIPLGTGAAREEAAYILDRLVGSVAGVPVTVRAEVPTIAVEENLAEADIRQRTCSGSVQRFVRAVVGASEDFGMPRELTAAAAVVSLSVAQQIAAFDIRICNTDRHGGNLLFQKNANTDAHPSCQAAYKPIPIDHGCALPRWWAMGEANFEAWATWPQVTVDCVPEVLASIEEAFQKRDEAKRLMTELGLEPAVLATYHIAARLLREGTIRHGFSLAVVAQLMSRDPYYAQEPSWLERQMAQCAAETGWDWHFEEDHRGDIFLTPPEEPGAWPPVDLLEKLEARFCDPLHLGHAGRNLKEL